MGMYDDVIVYCPRCGDEHEFQSKSGPCCLKRYSLNNCPNDVMSDINRHSPYKCDCGVELEVDVKTRQVIVYE